MSFFADVYSVFWADLRLLKRNVTRIIASSLIYPLLYLLVFGYGLGRSIVIEGQSYLDFVMPGIIALTSMMDSYNGASTKLHIDRLYYKCFDELLIAPISRSAIIVGKASSGVVRGLMSSLTMTVAGLLLSTKFRTNLQPPLHALLFLLSLLISCLVFAFFGVFVALTVKSHEDLHTFNVFIIVPMSFLSGTFFPPESVSEPIRAILYLSPLTHVSQNLRSIALGQLLPWSSQVALLGFGILFFMLCAWRLKNLSA